MKCHKRKKETPTLYWKVRVFVYRNGYPPLYDPGILDSITKDLLKKIKGHETPLKVLNEIKKIKEVHNVDLVTAIDSFFEKIELPVIRKRRYTSIEKEMREIILKTYNRRWIDYLIDKEIDENLQVLYLRCEQYNKKPRLLLKEVKDSMEDNYVNFEFISRVSELCGKPHENYLNIKGYSWEEVKGKPVLQKNIKRNERRKRKWKEC